MGYFKTLSLRCLIFPFLLQSFSPPVAKTQHDSSSKYAYTHLTARVPEFFFKVLQIFNLHKYNLK